MSKIPLAGESFRSEEEVKTRFRRNFLISLVALTLLGALIGLVEYFSIRSSVKDLLALHVLGDAFGLSGILGFAGFGLGYVSSKGAFDILSYSVKLVVLNIFAPKWRKENFPKTYYDYKVIKDHEERKAVFPLLWTSLIFLAVGVVLIIIYSNLI